MRIFCLFRSDLKILEDYHSIKDLEIFKKECWDFYLLMCINFLEKNIYDKIIIWRLLDEPKEDIIFKINGKDFIQRWIKDPNEIFNFNEKIHTSFFRGGFKFYDEITKKNPDFFGLKLYLGSSKRITPKYGGIYNKILVESDYDLMIINDSIPFYKTANNEIFKPLNLQPIFNICWIANFIQFKQKGQEYFISEISKSNYLKNQKIIHIGNKPELGKELCKKYGVYNITFSGSHSRSEINYLLNISKMGIVTSNKEDGCPRVITEIIISGTPLLIRNETRILSYYIDNSTTKVFNDLGDYIKFTNNNYNFLKNQSLKNIDKFSIEKVCEDNFKIWSS